MEKTLEQLEIAFQNAKKLGLKYIAVLIKMEGFPKPEIIINHAENFDTKLEYYKKAYDENLHLKANKGIQIIDFAYGNALDSIEYDIIEYPSLF